MHLLIPPNIAQWTPANRKPPPISKTPQNQDNPSGTPEKG
jgi:hypothetical protein